MVFSMVVLMRLLHRPSGRVPDIMFVTNEHLSRLKDTYLDGPADLAVEVVSPDSEKRDRRDKLIEYAAAGIPEYWLIDAPRREAHFYVLSSDNRYQDVPLSPDGVYTSTVLTGLQLRVEWLWRETLPTVDEALADLPA
jgi:Uma2 family endonuclease